MPIPAQQDPMVRTTARERVYKTLQKWIVNGTLLPGMVIQTALGEYASDPSSPVFWGLCLLMAAISLASALLYARWVRRKGEGASP